jgi:hypothetical protein
MKLDYTTFWPEEEEHTRRRQASDSGRPARPVQQRGTLYMRGISPYNIVYVILGWLAGFFGTILILGALALLNLFLKAIF